MNIKAFFTMPLAFLMMLFSLAFPPKAQAESSIAEITISRSGSAMICDYKIDLARRNFWVYEKSPPLEPRDSEALFEGYSFVGRLSKSKIAAFLEAADEYGFEDWEGKYGEIPPNIGTNPWYVTIIFADGTTKTSTGLFEYPENWAEMSAALNTLTGVKMLPVPVPEPPVQPQENATPAAGANDFAFRLSKALLQNNGKKNFVSSPYSVWLPLAALVNATDAAQKPALLAALGASGFDETDINEAAAEMLRSLTCEQMREYEKDYSNPLRIANAIFVDKKYTLNQNFKKSFADSYQGSAQSVDFLSPDAVKTVNDWASKNTDGLIKDIIEKFDPQTVAAIANAIYFSDRWSWEFDPDQTKKDTFHGTNGDTDAFFMLRDGNNQTYYEDDKLQAMPLRFKTGGGLYILLPKNGDANALLSSMRPAYFDKIQKDSIQATGKLLLPRFKIDSGVMKLVDALAALGVPLVDPCLDPLTSLIEETPVYISDAVQKAVIEVDEKGTTAAAVTVLIMVETAMPPPPTKPFSMVCDKPFAFILYGNGGQILFTGVVNQMN